MKIAFFGTGDFSKNILSDLFGYFDLEVLLIVSQPDKKVGRKKELLKTPTKEFGIKNNIETYQPDKLFKNKQFKEKLKNLDLDFIIVVAYGKIIPESILNIPKHGSINIHGSILPKYRGASPIQESIKNGDKKTGLTIMYMSKGMDEGDLLKIQEINIDNLDKTPDLFKKFEKIGAKLLYETLLEILSGKIKPVKQDNSNATYCKKIGKTDGKIDFSETTVYQIHNKFRAYYNWPGIYTYFFDKKLDIIDCIPLEFYDLELEKNLNLEELIPGKIIKINKKTIGIVCSDKKIIILKQLKLEGKKTIDILSFINGNKNFLEYKF